MSKKTYNRLHYTFLKPAPPDYLLADKEKPELQSDFSIVVSFMKINEPSTAKEYPRTTKKAQNSRG
jgi:hypothetical protein